MPQIMSIPFTHLSQNIPLSIGDSKLIYVKHFPVKRIDERMPGFTMPNVVDFDVETTYLVATIATDRRLSLPKPYGRVLLRCDTVQTKTTGSRDLWRRGTRRLCVFRSPLPVSIARSESASEASRLCYHRDPRNRRRGRA
jgi:hypothetical protein